LRKEKERGLRNDLEELHRDIQIGIDHADRGELSPLDALGTLKRIRGAQAKKGR
jgi:hypothetical protein